MLKKVVVALSLSGAVLLSGCVTQQKYQAEVGQAQSYQMLSGQLQSELNADVAQLNTDQVQIQQLQDRLKVTMVNELLFPEGGWQLHKQGEQVLAKIAPTLAKVQSGNIIVQGYTDNLAIGPGLRERFPSNWELAATRATDVVRYLIKQGVPANLLSAQSFGETRPIASNDTPEGRAKNRRVEIVITGQ
jgi:chemotaxis protein MotB